MAFFRVVAQEFLLCGSLVAVNHVKQWKSGSWRYDRRSIGRRCEFAPGFCGAAVIAWEEMAVGLIRYLDALVSEPHRNILYGHSLLEK